MIRSSDYNDAIQLLKGMIALPSSSSQESKTADLLMSWLKEFGLNPIQSQNNIWARNKHYDPKKPTLMLCSHHDTVPPSSGYTRDPFAPEVFGDKLYGLGSNDAGGALVSLLGAFRYLFLRQDLDYNVIFVATAEEEISGKNGIEAVLPELGKVDFAVIGEPTSMNAAVAEKGLMVLDCTALGKAGHAARKQGVNAISIALEDINWIGQYEFQKVSESLGGVHMNVTQIQGGKSHNVIPDKCQFVVDVRLTDEYTHEEVLKILGKHLKSEIIPRSTRLKPSSAPISHPVVQGFKDCGATLYGSDTTSDQALLNIPSLKIGPGDTRRSHMPDEFINLSEIKGAMETYFKVFNLLEFGA